jgi:23S rRNA G2445 N2-methylase RlmL
MASTALPTHPLPGPPNDAGTHRWVATCPEETKGVLQDELRALGVTEQTPIYRGVAFEADNATAYRAHLWLRTASRIQRTLAVVDASSISALETAVRALPWTAWVRPHRPVAFSPILADAAAEALGKEDVAATLGRALLAAFADAGEAAPRLASAGDDLAVGVVAFVRGGTCTLALDTAGRALHKRGWRLNGHPAVLKETLAASMLLLAGYDGSEPLLDPMCGSGTLVIEAAYIALNKAPLIHRGKDDFGLEHTAGFDRTLWRKTQDAARAARRTSPPAPLFGYDLRLTYTELARQTALRARVERFITWGTSPFQALPPPAPRGLMVANLPYGERIGRGQLEEVCNDLGRTLKARFGGWRVALLVPPEAARGVLNLRNVRDIPLMNGALPVKLLLGEVG